MGRAWTNEAVNQLVIPSGATGGARITINFGDDGSILIYDSNGVLVGSWSPGGGTGEDGTPYLPGFELQTDPAGGYLYAGFNPGSQISTVIILSAVPAANLSQQASIQAVTTRLLTTESLQMVGPAAAADTKDSYCELTLSSGSSTGTAQALLAYLDNTGVSPNVQVNSYGVLARAVFGGSSILGRAVQTDQSAAGTEGIVHWGQYSGAVAAGGAITFNHGAAFTPAFALMTPVTNFSQGNFAATFTATTASLQCYGPTGVAVAGGTNVVFNALFGL